MKDDLSKSWLGPLALGLFTVGVYPPWILLSLLMHIKFTVTLITRDQNAIVYQIFNCYVKY
jgi:hypothetical protein